MAIIDMMPERLWNCTIDGLTLTFIGPRRQRSMLEEDPKRSRPYELTFEFTQCYEVVLPTTTVWETKIDMITIPDERKKRTALCAINQYQQQRWASGVIFYRLEEVLVKKVSAWPWTPEECALQAYLLKHSD